MWWGDVTVPIGYEGLNHQLASTYSTPKFPYGHHAVFLAFLESAVEDFTHGDSGRKWFDCADCHHEAEDHPLLQSFDMVSSISMEGSALAITSLQTFACKKCRKCFRKDTQEFEDRSGGRKRCCSHELTRTVSDEYCPHCDNHFVLDAKTPKPALKVEGADARVDPRMLKDDRVQAAQQRSIFDVRDAAERLG